MRSLKAIREAASLLLLTLWLPAVPAADSASDQPDGVASPLAAAPPRAAAKSLAGPIRLDSRLRLLLRPVVMGLVAPADPQGYGECLVRVQAVEPGALLLHYEVKERLSIEQMNYSHQLVGVTDTVIRRGELRLDRQRGAAGGLLSPADWPGGSAEPSGGVLWLSAEQCEALRRGELDWGSGEPLRLSERQARYPCVINGREELLPALRASDGQADYWVLDDPANALVLKVSGRSRPLSEAGMARPEPPEQQESRGRRGTEVTADEATRAGDESAAAADPEAEKDEVLGLVNPGMRAGAPRRAEAPAEEPPRTTAAAEAGIGTGYAVVEINF